MRTQGEFTQVSSFLLPTWCSLLSLCINQSQRNEHWLVAQHHHYFYMMASSATTQKLLHDQHCYLIRNCLQLSEQIAIHHDICSRSMKENVDDKPPPPCMYPTPKTIIFSGNQSTLKFNGEDENVYNDFIVQNANLSLQSWAMKRNNNNDHQDEELLRITKPCSTSSNSTPMSVGVIRYQVPNGAFPEHVDHCNDNSWVYLLSLGCTANFVVRGRDKTKERQLIQLKSGDVLVFDPSSDAAILHGVKSISSEHPVDGVGEEVCPIDFQQYRFGVQCRVKLR